MITQKVCPPKSCGGAYLYWMPLPYSCGRGFCPRCPPWIRQWSWFLVHSAYSPIEIKNIHQRCESAFTYSLSRYLHSSQCRRHSIVSGFRRLWLVPYMDRIYKSIVRCGTVSFQAHSTSAIYEQIYKLIEHCGTASLQASHCAPSRDRTVSRYVAVR